MHSLVHKHSSVRREFFNSLRRAQCTIVRLGPFPTLWDPDRRREGIYGMPSMGGVAPYQKNRASKEKKSKGSRLGWGDAISAKKSNSRRGKASKTPNAMRTHSVECNECLNAKKEEIKRKEKKTHNAPRRTMPPVRHQDRPFRRRTDRYRRGVWCRW